MNPIEIRYGGDSNLRKYLTYIHNRHDNYKTSTNKIAIELAIGGQTVGQLQKRIKRCRSKYVFKIAKQITIMIGTNDILKNYSFSIMKNGMTRMLTQLKKSNVLVKLITIPPIISGTKIHKNRILYFNRFLRKLKYHNIILIDLHKSLRDDPRNYLERDGIHLNHKGLRKLQEIMT
ncbi:hypothetical protein RN001_008282 [Aquatica leii]|uniref:OSK domain-containing protein n=1 Tax=Aquatica leii TaxID=1421715 RepID=A0AAN7PD43_9COLE|nr:hypothetical protein RN001_008282 [Aquatica leii]